MISSDNSVENNTELKGFVSLFTQTDTFISQVVASKSNQTLLIKHFSYNSNAKDLIGLKQ